MVNPLSLRHFYIAIALISMASGCASLVRPNFSTKLETLRAGQYTLDPMHSFIYWRIGHLDLSQIVGRFNSIEATLDFDPQDPTNLQLQGRIDPTSIDLNNTELETELQKSAWFDSANHPAITFTSESTSINADSELLIIGSLKLRGVTRPVTVVAKFNGGADNILTRKYTLGFTARASFQRSDFGMDSFAAFVGDEVEVELHGEFQKK